MQHSKIISGIDIGSSKITTIIGQYFEVEDRINVIAVASIPAAGFRKGQIINIEQAGDTITQSVEAAERMAGFQINSATVAIGASYIESVNSHGVVAISNQNGEIVKEDIARVIEAAKALSIPNGKDIIHVIPRKYTVDGQDGVVDPVGMNGVRLEVEANLILCSSPAIKNLYKVFDEIGVKVSDLVYSGLVTAKAGLTETEKELGVVLVDMGGSITTITIFVEGSPAFSSVLPVGANNITNDLAIGLRYSIDDAERIKIKLNRLMETKKFENEIDLSYFGVSNEDKRKLSVQTAVSGIIKPRLEEIFGLVYQQIENSGFGGLTPAGIVLTGGGAQTVDAKEICSQVIPLPLRVASPPKLGGIVDEILNPAYTSSVGLLLYGLEGGKKPKQAEVRSKVTVSGMLGKIKGLIEPLLP